MVAAIHAEEIVMVAVVALVVEHALTIVKTPAKGIVKVLVVELALDVAVVAVQV